MSKPLPTRQPIEIHILWGKARGLKAVQATLHQCLINASKTAVRQTRIYMEKIVPESRFRKPPYPPSYKSESLLESALVILMKSLAEIESGSALKPRYFLKLGFPASYAGYLSRGRRPVKWSKPSSERGFYSKSKLFLIRAFKAALKDELATQRAAKLAVTKYIGTRSYDY